MSIFDDVSKKSLFKADDDGGDSEGFRIGDNPCRIKTAFEDVSKSGKDMLVVQFENRNEKTIKAYICEGPWKLRTLKKLMEAFDIDFEEYDLRKWRGKRGVVVCKEGEPYNGRTYPAVSGYKHLSSLSPQTDKKPEQKPKNADGFEDDIPF